MTHFNIVSYLIKLLTTSWTYSIILRLYAGKTRSKQDETNKITITNSADKLMHVNCSDQDQSTWEVLARSKRIILAVKETNESNMARSYSGSILGH